MSLVVKNFLSILLCDYLLITNQLPVIGKFRQPFVQNALRLGEILFIPLCRKAVVIICRQIVPVHV